MYACQHHALNLVLVYHWIYSGVQEFKRIFSEQMQVKC